MRQEQLYCIVGGSTSIGARPSQGSEGLAGTETKVPLCMYYTLHKLMVSRISDKLRRVGEGGHSPPPPPPY